MRDFTIDNRTFGHEFIINDLPILADGFLGNKFILEHEAVINYQNQDVFGWIQNKLYKLCQLNQRSHTTVLSSMLTKKPLFHHKAKVCGMFT
jgi:hypothetical protein